MIMQISCRVWKKLGILYIKHEYVADTARMGGEGEKKESELQRGQVGKTHTSTLGMALFHEPQINPGKGLFLLLKINL